MLISYAFFPFVGGTQVVLMSMISYVAATTPPHQRVKRLTILELIFITSNPLGVFVGGILIEPQVTSLGSYYGLLHNYHHVLILAIIFKLLALIYAAFFKFERAKPKSISTDIETSPLIITKPKQTRMEKISSGFWDLFVIQNIKESFVVCFQKRPSRSQIWLLMLAMTTVVVVNKSISTLMFQFVQKVYHWNASTYSTWNSILYVSTHVVGLLVVTPLLTKYLNVSDSTLLLVGLTSSFMQSFVRGTFINVYAFMSSYCFGMAAPVIMVAIRSYLSKLVSPSEQYRLFGTLSLLEVATPLLGNAIFTVIFNSTISEYPGTVFQVMCSLLLIPFSIAIYLNWQNRKRISPAKTIGHQVPGTVDHNNNPIVKTDSIKENSLLVEFHSQLECML